jgi:hypothetical protein
MGRLPLRRMKRVWDRHRRNSRSSSLRWLTIRSPVFAFRTRASEGTSTLVVQSIVLVSVASLARIFVQWAMCAERSRAGNAAMAVASGSSCCSNKTSRSASVTSRRTTFGPDMCASVVPSPSRPPALATSCVLSIAIAFTPRPDLSRLARPLRRRPRHPLRRSTAHPIACAVEAEPPPRTPGRTAGPTDRCSRGPPRCRAPRGALPHPGGTGRTAGTSGRPG